MHPSVPTRLSLLSLGCLLLLQAPFIRAGQPKPYQPVLFQSTKLVYEDDFNGPLNKDFWETRQGSTWTVKEGILHGGPSPKEFQDKMIAKGDRAHAGFKPVIWLKQVPAEFVCTMRMRYNAKDYHPKFPLLDLGHHFHTLVFGKDTTTLTIQKNVQTIQLDEPFLPLNEWVDVAIELRKGTLLLTMNGKQHRFETPHIDMGDQRQIDFKGVDFGSCEIDHIRIWEGR